MAEEEGTNITDGNAELVGFPPPSDRHNNADLFLWALGLTGGRDGYVDIEDVYMKCFELAPKRFGWRTRPDIPDLQKISVARRDAIKRQAAADVQMISAQETEISKGKPVKAYRWRLTNEGMRWLDEWSTHLEQLYGGGSVPTPRNRPGPTNLRRLRASQPFTDWEAKGEIESEVWELADLLECSPTSPARVWSQRLDALESVASQESDSKAMGFIRALKSWLKEGND